MNVNEPRGDGSAAGDELAAFYERHFGLLVGIAVGQFRVAESEAETLVHDVFLSLLLGMDRVVDRERWLVGRSATRAGSEAAH
jgi:DNA-directed RNA polymerase specialized sigma24 family protein